MRLKKSYIALNSMRFYAYHGVLAHEREIGQLFEVTLRLRLNLLPSAQSDELTDTVNYAEVHALTAAEMLVPSQLLEHVAYRIAQQIIDTFSVVSEVKITVCKLNPPMPVDLSSASVTLYCER